MGTPAAEAAAAAAADEGPALPPSASCGSGGGASLPLGPAGGRGAAAASDAGTVPAAAAAASAVPAATAPSAGCAATAATAPASAGSGGGASGSAGLGAASAMLITRLSGSVAGVCGAVWSSDSTTGAAIQRWGVGPELCGRCKWWWCTGRGCGARQGLSGLKEEHGWLSSPPPRCSAGGPFVCSLYSGGAALSIWYCTAMACSPIRVASLVVLARTTRAREAGQVRHASRPTQPARL